MVDQDNLAEEIGAMLKEKGPLIGKEIVFLFPRVDQLKIWQTCFQNPEFLISHFASYYLRYDVTREDQVRLSPSILRDFLSFTLFGLHDQRDLMVERQAHFANYHRDISRKKLAVAQTAVNSIFEQISRDARRKTCAFIAGDLSYYLAHDEPREHKASGEMIRGSDIDIIIVHENDLEDEWSDFMRSEMLSLKSFYLRHPDYRQELDFIVKPRAKLIRQFRYNDIRDKIASKIMYESMFLGGALSLYLGMGDEMRRAGVDVLIEQDFTHALEDRKGVMHKLLGRDIDIQDPEIQSLFFFSQERIEFT